MSIPFYRAFEDRYRGSRELIQERQQVYVPFLEPLKTLYPECRALDLGCGRGEWLEILLQAGFTPLGVDIDGGMLEACHALGLPVQEGDALQVLKNLPDESLTVVSGFHFAEHIPFDDLKVLVAETLRVLKPAGLLILETPNAENLTVGTQNFYLDPTHERPIPHLLLSFLTEYSGFNRSQLLRLQESAALAAGGLVDLMSVLHGVSPDYAIIAQKQASPEQLEKFDAVFDRSYGLSLEALARRYDAQHLGRLEQADASTIGLRDHLYQVEQHGQQLEIVVHELGGRSDSNHAEMKAQLREIGLRADLAEIRYQNVQLMQEDAINRAKEADIRLNAAFANIEKIQVQMGKLLEEKTSRENLEQLNVQTQLQEITSRLNESLSNAHHWWQQAKANEAKIAVLVNSKSWQITQPLRTSMAIFAGTGGFALRVIKRITRPILSCSMHFVLDRPGLRLRIRNKIKSHPVLFGRMRQFALHQGIMQPSPDEIVPVVVATEASEDGFLSASPRVARIYSELKLAFERKEYR
ncbi:bifunctional 2-polyprenyl-6-hydroxyphenol methylase/3-demethylubiquinol 3-O-methyltransferase UbiG [Pseudomonas sp.]|uniref:class I SAM-dependent methyltransferase n=1 Tax=Pseudomonas sp. TaxID=306 RepID=UPI00262A73CE|nr:class I SAM-dependent methyltransferase [Pseudomonas sp.]